ALPARRYFAQPRRAAVRVADDEALTRFPDPAQQDETLRARQEAAPVVRAVARPAGPRRRRRGPTALPRPGATARDAPRAAGARAARPRDRAAAGGTSRRAAPRGSRGGLPFREYGSGSPS